MAYFANGTEGETFQARWCYRCRNWREREGIDGVGCPVWDVHFLTSCGYGYRGEDRQRSEAAQDLLATLDWLITDEADPKCRMFEAVALEVDPRQLDLVVDDGVEKGERASNRTDADFRRAAAPAPPSKEVDTDGQ